mmetsp:Transcript_19073/g.44575  ORF Transcript_19073/g.44575 Transcript_19073/m.44575 type:complete len:528 (-) Transcript_19073:264-1847(-)
MTSNGAVQENHLHLAAKLLLAIPKPTMRPSTLPKLEGVLRRRGCCSYVDYHKVRPEQLLAALLRLCGAEKKASTLASQLELLQRFVAASEAGGSEEAKEPEAVTQVAQRAFTLLLTGKSSWSKTDDIESVAAWLCGQAQVRVSTDASDLGKEMQRLGLIQIQGEKLLYVEQKLKEWTSLAKMTACQGGKAWNPKVWLSNYLCSASGMALLKSPTVSEGLNFRFVQCTRHISGTELRDLAQHLWGSYTLSFERRSMLMKVRAKARPQIPLQQACELVNLVMGQKPVLSCGKYPRGLAPHVIGRGGRYLRKVELEMEQNVRLVLIPAEDSDSSAELAGWIRVKQIESKPDFKHGDWKKLAEEQEVKIKKMVQAHLEEVNERGNEKAHGAGRRGPMAGGGPALGRTFSSEYQTMKNDRSEGRERGRRKEDQRKKNRADKEDRLGRLDRRGVPRMRQDRPHHAEHGGRSHMEVRRDAFAEAGEGREELEDVPEGSDNEQEAVDETAPEKEQETQPEIPQPSDAPQATAAAS